MRDEKGRFVKGIRSSKATEFKPGTHWRGSKPFWDKEWLVREYVTLGRSTGEIAEEWNVTDANILYWLKKHKIERRDVSEARALKHWGQTGSDNPMWNRRDEANHNWKGGVTPERQAFYQSAEWKAACSAVWKRDNATCQRCGLERGDSDDIPMHIHHIVSFADKELRADINNLVLLCEICHHFVHSRENVDREYLR